MPTPITTSSAARRLASMLLPEGMSLCREGSAHPPEATRAGARQIRDEKAFLLQWGLRGAHPSFSVLTLETASSPREDVQPGRTPGLAWHFHSPGQNRRDLPPPTAPPPRLRSKTFPLHLSKHPLLSGLCQEQRANGPELAFPKEPNSRLQTSTPRKVT